MSALAKNILKEFVSRTPVLREKYFEWEFLRRRQTYRGIYRSFAEATADAPAKKLIGYNHKETVDVGATDLENLNQGDYPVLFWLTPLAPAAGTVFDFGGNVGVAWFAYRKYISFPARLRWMVCEVPATVETGTELAQQKGETQLFFTANRAAAEDADIYFSAGALQYIEEPLADMLAKLTRRPAHLLINRVPLCDGPSFITLQNNGAWIVPYRIVNRAEFVQGVTALGYELVDSWKVARSLRVLGSPEHFAENFHGMYFRRK